MDRVSESDIRRFVSEYEALQGETVDVLLRAYLAATDTLAHLLTPSWMFEHVFGKSQGPAFLRPDPQTDQDAFRHQDRVIALADLVFNLQDVQGAEGRLQRMLTSDVESLVAELEGAKLLVTSGIPVRFVDETGVAGKDYDIEATIDGLTIACETKCKIETTGLSAATIRNVLNTARGQLPAKLGSIVFLRIPEEWVRDPSVSVTVEQAISSSFRRTERISAVILHWEEWHLQPGGGTARFTRHRTEHNPRARVSLQRFGSIVKPLPTAGWRHLLRIVTP